MTYKAPADLKVGHAHLRVSDLERSIDFYRDVLGFEVQTRSGTRAAFLAAGGYHHHLGLNTWHSAGGAPAPRTSPGLYHVAYLYPTLEDLRRAAAHIVSQGVEIYGYADHGVSIALYFDDPDGNGIEIYWDRPEADWPRAEDGALQLGNKQFDVAAFIAGKVHKTESEAV